MKESYFVLEVSPAFDNMYFLLLLFFRTFPPPENTDDFIDKNPRKTQVAFPRGFSACGDCGHLSQTATHSQHVEENLPILQKLLTRCGVVGEHNDPQSRCLCQEKFCFSNFEAVGNYQIWKGWNNLWKQLLFWSFAHIYCMAERQYHKR